MSWRRFLSQGAWVPLLLLLVGLSDSSLEAASLTLSWTDNSYNEDGFRIERMVSGGVLTQVATVGANTTSYADSNLTSGLNYCYVVRAFNSAGISDASNAACATAVDRGTSTTQSGSGANAANYSAGSVMNLSNDVANSRSARGAVLTGDNMMITGFIISGDSPKTMLIRARGPTLADLGVTDVLHDPFLSLFSGQTLIAQNDNWRDTQAQAILATGLDPCEPLEVGGPPPTDCGRESAILMTLNPGAYTAMVSGVAGETGIGLVEVYEVGNTSSRLVNMSTRGRVGTQDNVLIGGFIIDGNESKTLLLRARGPSLADFGVSDVLSDPMLQLYSGQTVIARNDNWQTVDPLCGAGGSPCGSASQITTLGLDPCQPYQQGGPAPTGCNRESAMLVTLAPGAYTMMVSGSGGSTGVALLEIYDVN